MKKHEFISKNLEESLKKAEEELKIEKDQFYYKETEEEKGLLKLKKTKTEVLKKQDVIEYVKNEIKEITSQMNIKINIETKIRENNVQINIIPEEKSAILIGKNGKTIDALQLIIKNSIYNKTGFKLNILIDAENYKNRKNKNLEYYSKKIANEVKRTGVEAKLDYMNSYERRIVHNMCNNIKGIKTESKGEEPERYIVIKKE